MRPANALRGEVVLAVGGSELRLRPAFEALVAAEAELGSLFGLIERAGRGDVRLADVAGLFWHCCADGRGTDRAAFEDRLLADGLAVLVVPYRTLLVRLFGG